MTIWPRTALLLLALLGGAASVFAQGTVNLRTAPKGSASFGTLTSSDLGADIQALDIYIRGVASAIAVTGPLTDSQLRASAVSVSAADLDIRNLAKALDEVYGVLRTDAGTAYDARDRNWTITEGLTISSFPDNEPFNLAQYGGLATGAGNALHVQPGTGASFAVTGPLTDTQLRATAVAISGTVTANAGTGTLAVSGPLTDTQLRATAVPISGTVTANAGTGTLAVSGPLTDTQLRATAVPVSGTITANQGGTWTVQPGNTANTTAWKVDGSAVTQPVSGTVTIGTFPDNEPFNLNQLAGTALAAPFDVDSGAGTQSVAGVSLRKAASGGSVEYGTSTDPLRVDPTGTTTQPVSGTITANAGTGTFTVGGTVTSNQGTPAVTANRWPVQITDGTDLALVTAAGAVVVDGSGVTQPVSGTVTANAGTNLNTSTLALEAGGNLATLAGTVTTSRVAVNPISGQAGVQGGAGVSTALTQRVALATDANTIQGTVTANQGGTWTVQPGNTANTTAWKVDGSAVTQPVSGTVTANAGTGTLAVSGPLTDTQLRATPVPVSGTVTANPATYAGKTLTYVSVNQSAAGTTTLAAASVGNKHKLLSTTLTMSAAGTLKFTDGVGDLTGPMDVAATGGFVESPSIIPYRETGATNRALNLVTTTGAARGSVVILTEP